MKSLRKQPPVTSPVRTSGAMPRGGEARSREQEDVKLERGVKNVGGDQVLVSASSTSSGNAVKKSGRVKVRSSLMFNLVNDLFLYFLKLYYLFSCFVSHYMCYVDICS